MVAEGLSTPGTAEDVRIGVISEVDPSDILAVVTLQINGAQVNLEPDEAGEVARLLAHYAGVARATRGQPVKVS